VPPGGGAADRHRTPPVTRLSPAAGITYCYRRFRTVFERRVALTPGHENRVSAPQFR
jgi:hypothetical protein